MTDTLLNWFSLYGAYALVAALMIGQTGIPVPTSILLLTVGAMLADGIIGPFTVFFSSLVGASAGDQIGYHIGRAGGPPLSARIHGSRWHHLLERAERYSDRWGAPGVFFSRWLVSPVGPYINYLAGMTKLPWYRFTLMSVSGEAIWIAGYLSLGALFSTSISAVNELLANFTWFAGALAVSIYLGFRVRKVLNRPEKQDADEVNES